MHKQVRKFVSAVKHALPEYFMGRACLEFGALNVNGDARDLWEQSTWVGVDCVAGRNVDVVCLAHEVPFQQAFDVVASFEALEHDPHWIETLRAMVRCVRPGGLIIGSCAAPGRGRHGTRDRPHRDGSFPGPDPDYYRCLGEHDILSVIDRAQFSRFAIFTIPHPAGTMWYGTTYG